MKINTKPKDQSHRGRDKYYQSKKHKRLKQIVKTRDKGICQGCAKLGFIHLAGKYGTNDHIIPRNTTDITKAILPEGWTMEEFERLKNKIINTGYDYDILENQWLVCKEYHDKKSAKEKG